MIGHSVDSLEALMTKIGATSVDDVLRYLGGKSTMGGLMKGAGQTMNAMTYGQACPKLSVSMAGSKIGRGMQLEQSL